MRLDINCVAPFCRSSRESSCLTVVLNNLRVFLILEWLQLVQNFLQVPVANASSNDKPSHTSTESATATPSTTGAVMPKTVKSGVVTKRSTVPVTLDRCLDVKINVTGQCNHFFKTFSFTYWNYFGAVCYNIENYVLTGGHRNIQLQFTFDQTETHHALSWLLSAMPQFQSLKKRQKGL